MFLKVDNVGAERMSSGRLFQVTGSVTQNESTNNMQQHKSIAAATKTLLSFNKWSVRACAVSMIWLSFEQLYSPKNGRGTIFLAITESGFVDSFQHYGL